MVIEVEQQIGLCGCLRRAETTVRKRWPARGVSRRTERELVHTVSLEPGPQVRDLRCELARRKVWQLGLHPDHSAAERAQAERPVEEHPEEPAALRIAQRPVGCQADGLAHLDAAVATAASPAG